MFDLKKALAGLRTAQWVLIGTAVGAGIAAVILGVADNPPGIGLMYLALACLAGAWVWAWPSPREYWRLLVLGLAAFPVGVVLHNLLYALGTVVSDIPVLREVVNFLGVFFFLVAVAAVGPVVVVALLGGIITSWQGMQRLTRVNRSIRRFKESHRIKESTLENLVNLARQSASSANLQPLKFILSCSPEKNQTIFPSLSWAGYLNDWTGPAEGERPAGYIILLGDRELANSFQYDAGIASQSITLGAAELGLGACLIGSIKKDQLRRALAIPDQFEILLVIALGKPAEIVLLEEINPEESIRYWRDEQGRHHVPKRQLEELIF